MSPPNIPNFRDDRYQFFGKASVIAKSKRAYLGHVNNTPYKQN